MNSTVTTKPRLVILISGRGTNLQAIIEAIDTKRLEATIEAVISDRPKAQGLGKAAAYGLRTISLDYRSYQDGEAYHQELRSHLEALNPDLIILSGYMRILPAEIVRAYRWRILNIHPSLLPSFPGLHPHQQALDYGVKVSGCTVHFVDEGMDTGPIVMQAAVSVEDDDTADTLAARVLAEEHRLYPAAIQQVLQGTIQVVGRRVLRSAPEVGLT